MSNLFSSLKIGPYEAKNRIFMAPMSRYRADKNAVNPDISVDYYRQRASAGLIIAESTRVNNWSGGINCPGIYQADQIAQWKEVTNAVHKEGGLIFLQLWHSGRATHKSLLPEGRDVIAPSAFPSTEQVVTEEGMVTPTPPRAITLEEVSELRTDFAKASANALEAGFDGVEIHAAGGFIIDTFLQETTNQRDDAYGGSIENRYRFLKEIMEDSIAIWGANRVGVKLSPTSAYNDMGSGDIRSTFTYVYKELNKLNLAFLEINEEMPFSEPDAEKRNLINDLKTLWDGVYIANGNYDAVTAAKSIEDGRANAISFGRLFLANPDLPERFKKNASFNTLDPTTFYGGDHKGYIDYPFLETGL